MRHRFRNMMGQRQFTRSCVLTLTFACAFSVERVVREQSLKMQLIVTTVAMVPVTYLLALAFLPEKCVTVLDLCFPTCERSLDALCFYRR